MKYVMRIEAIGKAMCLALSITIKRQSYSEGWGVPKGSLLVSLLSQMRRICQRRRVYSLCVLLQATRPSPVEVLLKRCVGRKKWNDSKRTLFRTLFGSALSPKPWQPWSGMKLRSSRPKKRRWQTSREGLHEEIDDAHAAALPLRLLNSFQVHFNSFQVESGSMMQWRGKSDLCRSTATRLWLPTDFLPGGNEINKW